MSYAERKLMKDIDKIILSESEEELKKMREIDFQSQLGGKSFYEVYIEFFKNKNKETPTSQLHSFGKHKKE